MNPRGRRVAILGAGPVGLEAALYACKLGYSVRVYEQGHLGNHLRQFAHVRWFTPWRRICSPLAARCLKEHDPQWLLPWDEAPTAAQIVARLLEPLARLPQLAAAVHQGVRVLAVGRTGLLKTDLPPERPRAGVPFRLLLEDEQGHQWCETADVVLDCTGTFGRPNPLGDGGLPAPGEETCKDRIHRGLPDVLGAQRAWFAGRRVLVVGSGYSAATSVVALAQLAREVPGTRVWWITRRVPPPGQGPIARWPGDPLPLRDELARQANHLALAESPVTWLPGVRVERLVPAGGKVHVALTGNGPHTLEVERILSHTGYRGDWSLTCELHLHQCYATQGPIRLAASLLQNASGDCLQQGPAPAELLATPEPDFFVLGAKSYGRNSQFLLQRGWHQVRDVFRLLSDGPPRDLYAEAAARLERIGIAHDPLPEA